MALVTLTPPVQFPVSLDDAKGQIRGTGNAEDDTLQRMIAAATARVESYLRRRLIRQLVELRLDRLAPRLSLPLAPVIEIDEILCEGPDGAEISVPGERYRLLNAAEGPVVVLEDGQAWPDHRRRAESVRVRFWAGYGPDPEDVPEDIRHALLMLVGHFFEHREAVLAGAAVAELPLGFSWIADPHVFWI